MRDRFRIHSDNGLWEVQKYNPYDLAGDTWFCVSDEYTTKQEAERFMFMMFDFMGI